MADDHGTESMIVMVGEDLDLPTLLVNDLAHEQDYYTAALIAAVMLDADEDPHEGAHGRG